MEIGAIVNVYEDPVTQERLEGKAIIRKCLDPDPEHPRYLVRFVGTGDNGLYERAIL